MNKKKDRKDQNREYVRKIETGIISGIDETEISREAARGIRDAAHDQLFPNCEYQGDYSEGVKIVQKTGIKMNKLINPKRVPAIHISGSLYNDILFCCKKMSMTEPEFRRMSYSLLSYLIRNNINIKK